MILSNNFFTKKIFLQNFGIFIAARRIARSMEKGRIERPLICGQAWPNRTNVRYSTLLR